MSWLWHPWLETALALEGTQMPLLLYSTGMPKLKRKELRPRLFMGRALKSIYKKNLWDRRYFCCNLESIIDYRL